MFLKHFQNDGQSLPIVRVLSLGEASGHIKNFELP